MDLLKFDRLLVSHGALHWLSSSEKMRELLLTSLLICPLPKNYVIHLPGFPGCVGTPPQLQWFNVFVNF